MDEELGHADMDVGLVTSDEIESGALSAASEDDYLLTDRNAENFVSASTLESGVAFEHPDAQRRFRTIKNAEELERALAYPWEKWIVFLHPDQRDWVERDFNGPARASGSAGTGKTIVALHRAAHLARQNPDARVLLTTFSEALANALKKQVRRLTGNEPRLAERLEVHSLNAIGERLYELHFGKPKLASRDRIREVLAAAVTDTGGSKFSHRFLLSEWEDVVDAWQLGSWEAYRDIARLGRKTRLAESHRKSLWAVFEKVHLALERDNLQTYPRIFRRLTSAMVARKHPPFDFAVVDESQDIRPSQLRFLSALAGDRPNALFFTGDLGQRIFQQPFSWKSLGVEVRGRSRTLHINYRTSHQIRMQADRLVGPTVSDIDGNSEDRTHTVSTFNGPAPILLTLQSQDAEIETLKDWLVDQVRIGVLSHEIAVIVRSEEQLPRARSALEAANLQFNVLDEKLQSVSGSVCLCTMHLAKGLEFRSVAVMACDDEVIPLQARIESVTDDSDLEEVYNTERQLLYVACTRARDHLLVTGVDPVSEFLGDISAAR
jgi:superfamily I DNA/RNA helicase